MLLERFGDLEVYLALEEELGRSLTLHEVIAAEMATCAPRSTRSSRGSSSNVRVRPGFRELVAEHDPLIVSAGFHETIEPILRREGSRPASSRTTSPPIRPVGATTFAERATCATCDERCKRAAVAGLGPYVYVGDGVSDRCVSLAAERRFARDGLARWLDERGRPATSRSTTCTTCAQALAGRRARCPTEVRTPGGRNRGKELVAAAKPTPSGVCPGRRRGSSRRIRLLPNPAWRTRVCAGDGRGG